MPPLPPHPYEIVGVHRKKVRLPESVHEIIERRKSVWAPRMRRIELLTKSHDRPQLRMTAQTDSYRARLIKSAVPGRIRFEGILVRTHKKIIVRRHPSEPGKWQRPLHHVGIPNRPFISLLRAHRPAQDKLQLLDVVALRYQTMLRANI